LLAQVRAWFGLNQAELALYLGSSKAQVQAIESGQRRLGASLHAAVLPLAQQLPAPEALATLAAPPPVPAADAQELDFRRRTCQQQAARLGQELAGLEQQARVAQRWAQALPALLPATAGPDPERAAWLHGWLLRRASLPAPEAATRLHLLRARLAGLQAELAALAMPAETVPATYSEN
jgi:DNA-binding XRE family transcriptional regulator